MAGSREVAVRVMLSVGVVLWLQVGPLFHQVLALPIPPFAMAWTMYSGVGRDLCTARFIGAGGRPVGGVVPRHLHSAEEVRRAGRALCGAAGGQVHADAWCAGPDGRWVRAVAPEEPLCPR